MGWVHSKIFIDNNMLTRCDAPQATLVEDYSHDMMNGVETLWACPKVLRPYYGYLIPRLHALHRSVRGLERLMRPVVEEHLRSMSRDSNEWAKDATQWHLNHSDDCEKHDLKFQTLCQILLASVGTDAMSIIVGDIWVHGYRSVLKITNY